MLIIDIHLRAEVKDEVALLDYYRVGTLPVTPESVAAKVAEELSERLAELLRVSRTDSRYEVEIKTIW